MDRDSWRAFFSNLTVAAIQAFGGIVIVMVFSGLYDHGFRGDLLFCLGVLTLPVLATVATFAYAQYRYLTPVSKPQDMQATSKS